MDQNTQLFTGILSSKIVDCCLYIFAQHRHLLVWSICTVACTVTVCCITQVPDTHPFCFAPALLSTILITISIPYFLVIRRISLVSTYSLISAYYIAGLYIRRISPISVYVTLDPNIWHVGLLAQAEGFSLFDLVEIRIATVNSSAFS